MDSMPFTKELTAQDELRIIEKISDEIVKRRLETMAIMFLETIKPLSFVGSQLAITFVGPFLGIFGNLGVDYIMFFNKHENVEKLLKRIEEKIKILDEEEKKAKQQSKSISTTYGIKLDLTPGYEHLPDIGGGDRERTSTRGDTMAIGRRWRLCSRWRSGRWGRMCWLGTRASNTENSSSGRSHTTP